jgi:hypothetical protein
MYKRTKGARDAPLKTTNLKPTMKRITWVSNSETNIQCFFCNNKRYLLFYFNNFAILWFSLFYEFIFLMIVLAQTTALEIHKSSKGARDAPLKTTNLKPTMKKNYLGK